MIRLIVFAATVWLAMVLGSPTQAQPPAPIVVTPPPGISLHLTNPQMYRDRAGVIFAATRASSQIGGVVWKVEAGQTTTVLQLGPGQAFANGELVIWPDGLLYYVTVDQAATRITAYPVPGWTP